MGCSVLMNKKLKEMEISGREFSLKEIENVIETVNMFSNLTRTELSNTICVHLDWFTPSGNYKTSSARKLLEKLQDKGLVELPELINTNPNPGLPQIEITSRTDSKEEIKGTVSDYSPVVLKKVQDKSSRGLWNEYIERYHDLGHKRPFGARQRYFIVSNKEDKSQKLGCILFSAAAWSLEERDTWIGWQKEHRSKYLNGVVNNTRFLIFPWVKIKNLASKALSLAAKRIRADWKERYNYRPVLIETFVDETKYQGTCYKAANWEYLGKTKGRGRQDRKNEYKKTVKLIYVYPLVNNFRDYLLGKCPEWGLCQ